VARVCSRGSCLQRTEQNAREVDGDLSWRVHICLHHTIADLAEEAAQAALPKP